jgi:hypothetical protein
LRASGQATALCIGFQTRFITVDSEVKHAGDVGALWVDPWFYNTAKLSGGTLVDFSTGSTAREVAEMALRELGLK